MIQDIEIRDEDKRLLNVQDEVKSNWPRYQINILRHVKRLTPPLWPWAFYAMFFYDVHNYRDRDNRYQVDGWALAFGLSRNYHPKHASLSTNLGGNIPRFVDSQFGNFWYWTILLVPMALRLGLYCSRFYTLERELIETEYALPQQDEKHSHDPRVSDLTSVHLISEIQEASQKFKKIEERAKASYFSRLLAIATLVEIYKARSEDHIGRAAHDHLLRAYGDRESWLYHPLVVDKLTRYYARFKLWPFNRGKPLSTAFKRVIHIAEWLWWGYPFIRLMSLFSQKIIQIGKYAKDKADCQYGKDNYKFIPEIGRCECTPCYGRYNASYMNSTTGAGCFAALMAEPRDPHYLLTELQRIQHAGPFPVLDFSHQEWTYWSLSDWQAILNFLNTSDFKYASTLNLSSVSWDGLWVSPDLLKPVGDYLSWKNPVRTFDLGRRGLSNQSVTMLLPGIENNPWLSDLRFSQSGLSDSTFNSLLWVLPTLPALTKLDVSQNSLTSSTIPGFNAILPNTTLISLNLGMNLWTASDVDQLIFNGTQLQELIFEQVDLSRATLVNFAALTINSALIKLILRNCRMTDSQINVIWPGICQSKISSVDLSGNQISHSGTTTMASCLFGITELNLGYNALTDSDMDQLAKPLTDPRSRLITLILSGNPSTAVGFQALIPAFNATTRALQTLEFDFISIGDAGIEALTTTTSPQNISLTRLSLVRTQLTNLGGSLLLQYIGDASLTDVDLSHNPIGGNLSQPLKKALKSPLRRLHLCDSGLSPDDLQTGEQSVWTVMPDSKLEFIDISQNKLNGSLVDLVRNLITEAPNEDIWFYRLDNDYDFNAALQDTTNSSQCQSFILPDGLPTTVYRAFCLAGPPGQTAATDIVVSGNDWDAATGVSGCPTGVSTVWSSRVEREVTSSWLLIAALIWLALRANPIVLILLSMVNSSGVEAKRVTPIPEKTKAKDLIHYFPRTNQRRTKLPALPFKKVIGATR